MRWWGTFAAFLLVAILVGTPAMACVASAADLTPAERECCEHMAGQCDGMSGSGHSCCETTVRPASPFLSAQHITTNIDLNLSVGEAATALFMPAVPPNEVDRVLAAAHPPPGIKHISVLRI